MWPSYPSIFGHLKGVITPFTTIVTGPHLAEEWYGIISSGFVRIGGTLSKQNVKSSEPMSYMGIEAYIETVLGCPWYLVNG